MKILIVPDSFKGTLSSKEVCVCIENGIKSVNADITVESIPFSDGGEGFTECMMNICKGNILYTDCHNIFNRPIKALVLTFGSTAVIECASASGLLDRKDVMSASSYGTGELIKFAVNRGYKQIILGLGGTGCCDGGAGALSALGVNFYDENYSKISRPSGKDLNYIFGAGFSNCVKDISFTFACDVDSVYYGEKGAAYIFAPQKGANAQQVKELDEGLKRLNAFLPEDISALKGGGAAGGICGGLYSVYGGIIKPGFDILSEYARLEEKIAASDIIITGEGKTDSQTLSGKLPFRVAALAKKCGKRCYVISGVNEGIMLGDKCISLADGNITSEQAMKNAAEILTEKSKLLLQ